jgi:hypothetical protein
MSTIVLTRSTVIDLQLVMFQELPAAVDQFAADHREFGQPQSAHRVLEPRRVVG